MKIIKILITNILIMILFLLILDFCLYKKFVIQYKMEQTREIQETNPPIDYIDNYISEYGFQTYQSLKKHINIFGNRVLPVIKNISNGSILMFGCSYTHGDLLEDNETLSYLIYEKTKRNVFNYGISSGCVQHILYLLSNMDLNELKSYNPEYVIYIYLPEHLFRVRSKINPNSVMVYGSCITYKINDNGLELQKPIFPDFFYKTYIVKAFLYKLDEYIAKNTLKNRYDSFLLFNEILLQSKKKLCEEFPNIKFIILRYRINGDEEYRELPFMWDVLKAEGFIIIDTEELIGRKFEYGSEDCAEDGYHPSLQTWKILVPKIIDKLNL